MLWRQREQQCQRKQCKINYPVANDGEGWRHHSLWHKGLGSCSACLIARGTLGSAAEGKNQPRGGSLQAAETPTQVLCLRGTKHVVWCFEDPALFRIRPQSWCKLKPGRCSAVLQLLPFKSTQSFSTSPSTLALVTPLIFLRSLQGEEHQPLPVLASQFTACALL